MSAYAHYEAQDYDSTIGAAQRYITLHPGSPDAAYAQYLIAASHFDQIPDISRDQGRTEKAIAALEEVVRKYPNSEYASAARRKLESARDQLAGKEMDVGRYYMERRDFTGAINRYKTVVTQYQRTRHVEEALARLTEAYMAIGIVDEAQTAAALLGHNFPDSAWYKDAYNLVKSQGLEPSENKSSWMSRALRKVGSRQTRPRLRLPLHACASFDPRHCADRTARYRFRARPRGADRRDRRRQIHPARCLCAGARRPRRRRPRARRAWSRGR